MARVLVADDSSGSVSALVALLRDAGFDARGVYDGRDAAVELAEFEPHALIVDVTVPGMTGWDVARLAREVSAAGCPILIAISDEYTKGPERILMQMAGFDYFLSKPLDPNVLASLLAPLKAPHA